MGGDRKEIRMDEAEARVEVPTEGGSGSQTVHISQVNAEEVEESEIIEDPRFGNLNDEIVSEEEEFANEDFLGSMRSSTKFH